MIDHVSIPVKDLERSGAFYDALLAPLGFVRIVAFDGTIAYGKRYAEFWLNEYPDMPALESQAGRHYALRAPDTKAVEAFHAAAIASGGESENPPQLWPQYTEGYFAAFIRDPDGNRIEAVHFLQGKPQ